jgi:hypothetical protein
MIALVVLAVALLGPAVAAAAVLLHLVLIVVGVIVGESVTAVGACSRGGGATGRQARPASCPPIHQKMARAASPLPQARRPPAIPSETARELPVGLNFALPWRELEDIAAILAREAPPGPDGNRPGVPQQEWEPAHTHTPGVGNGATRAPRSPSVTRHQFQRISVTATTSKRREPRICYTPARAAAGARPPGVSLVRKGWRNGHRPSERPVTGR